MISISLSREGAFVTMDGTTTYDDKACFDEAMRRLRAMSAEPAAHQEPPPPEDVRGTTISGW